MHCAKCFFYESNVGDDVCNRCGRAYLPEANVYLGLLLLVTGGAAWTLRHLLTGHMSPFARPGLDLGAWATWPVSLVERPAYGLVVGAWLAMLAAAPILTSLMYGKRGGWLLTIVIAVMGPSFWMAGAVALGVWIAAGYTVRLGSKVTSAFLGLIPVAAYWFVATALTDFSKAEPSAVGALDLAVLTDTGPALAPALQSLVYVPPIAAVVVAASASAVVVAVGRADRWHIRWPGALLTVLTAGPVLALLAFIGIDEVRYGMVLSGGVPVGPWATAGLSETERLQDFLARHPNSPRADRVRARLATFLERDESTDHTDTGVQPSHEVWAELLKRHPTSPFSADARLHLGDADARQGLFEAAEKHYREALAQTAPVEVPAENPLAESVPIWHLFTVGADLRAREDAEHLSAGRQEVLTRLAILADNRADTQENSRALGLYFVALRLKGTNAYREGLLAVREADPKGALADNVAYDLAMFEADDAKRVEALIAVAAQWPDTDGAMLAHLQAGEALVARAAADPAAMREAQKHFVRVEQNLEARKMKRPDDPYVTALADRIQKELVYVQAQLRRPKAEGED